MSADIPQKYGTLLTAAGKQAIALAIASDTMVNIKYVALGDGAGAEYMPTEEQTDLKRQVYQAEANSITIDPDNPNRIYVELVLPETVGGFTVREAAIKSESGTVIAVGTNPSYYKPVVAEGAATAIGYKFILEVTNASVVTLKIDPSHVYATISYVINAIENHSKQTNVHGGTYEKTPLRLMFRNKDGRCQVGGPLVGDDATPMWWIEEYVRKYGISKWSESVTYSPLPWIVWGSDNMIYIAINPSGPGLSSIGPKDPTSTKGYWISFGGYLAQDFWLLKRLTANLTIHVNRNTGDDATADGTLAKPFKAISTALLYVANNFHLSIYNVTIQVASGVYPEGLNLPLYMTTTGSISIVGDNAVNTIIDCTAISRATALTLGLPSTYTLNNIQVKSSALASVSYSTCVSCSQGVLVFGNVILTNQGVTNGIGLWASGGRVILGMGATPSAHQISITMPAGGAVAINMQGGSRVSQVNNISITGTANTAIAQCTDGSAFDRSPTNLPIVIGVATGRRYAVDTNAIINTFGGGANYFPGTVAGTIGNGGQYV